MGTNHIRFLFHYKILLSSTAREPAQVLPQRLQADQGHQVRPAEGERVRGGYRVSDLIKK